jgi:hypothetical protein
MSAISRVKLATLLSSLAVALVAMLGTPAGAAAAEGGCSNETVREHQSSLSLPDCRGYELVSPVVKNGEEVDYPGFSPGLELPFLAAKEGAGVEMTFLGGPPGAESAGEVTQAISRGGAAGSWPWSFESLAPNSKFGPILLEQAIDYAPTAFISPSLSCSVQQTRLAQPMPGNDEVPLLPPNTKPEENVDQLYVAHAGSNARELVSDERPFSPNAKKAGAEPSILAVLGATGNCEHVAFEETNNFEVGGYEYPLEPGSSEFAPTDSLYEWQPGTGPGNGRLALASRLPDGKPAANGVRLVNSGEVLSNFHSVTGSTEHWRIYFTAAADEGLPGEAEHPQVFLREDGTHTIAASATQTETADGGAKFIGASEDGSKVFFMANYGIAKNATKAGLTIAPRCEQSVFGAALEGNGCDLYEYNVASKVLTDLSPAAEEKAANVRGVVGMSDDGSYVYFTAAAQLVPGEGNSQAANEEKAQANVYAYHEGHISFVARVRGEEAGAAVGSIKTTEVWDSMEASDSHSMHYLAARVSANGQYLMLATRLQLTSYDNIDATHETFQKTPLSDPEYYEYHYTAGPGSVTCVSCNPSGAKPNDIEGLNPMGALGTYLELKDGSILRNLMNDGRVFFDDYQLLPSATTNMVHVYEWQPAGITGCTPQSPSFDNGCLGLLDGGKSTFPTYFEGASSDGENVYITSTQKLAPEQDTDGLRDLYDVRVGGGSLVEVKGPGCEANGEECQTGGSRLELSKRESETPGSGNPPLEGAKPKQNVEAFVEKAVAVRKHSHSGNTITLVIAAPGKGKVSISGNGVGAAGKSVAKSGSYTVRLTLGKKAKTAVKQHKKLKVKLRVSFKPSNGKASAVTVTITV